MSEIKELAKVFSKMDSEYEIEKFIYEIFTDNEINNLSLRWELLKRLNKKETQREISKNLGISLCKITRGAKILKKDNSVIKKILDEQN